MENSKKKQVLLFYCVESEDLARKVASQSDLIHLQSINWRFFPFFSIYLSVNICIYICLFGHKIEWFLVWFICWRPKQDFCFVLIIRGLLYLTLLHYHEIRVMNSYFRFLFSAYVRKIVTCVGLLSNAQICKPMLGYFPSLDISKLHEWKSKYH